MKGKVVVMKPWHSKDNNVTDKHWKLKKGNVRNVLELVFQSGFLPLTINRVHRGKKEGKEREKKGKEETNPYL